MEPSQPTLPGPKGWDLPSLSDHLLEEFLVRINIPADLIRASAACKAFRRVVTDPTFLRRYRSLHPHPPLLGFILSPVFGFQPHRTFAGADVAASFSLDHLPDRRGGWSVCDARHGRLLLRSSDPDRPRGALPGELVVCSSWTHEYTLLPPIPHTLLAVHTEHEDIIYFDDAFFDPTGSYNEAHFRIMCWTRGETIGAIFLYTSASRAWTHAASVSCHALGFHVQLLQWEDMYGSLPNRCHGRAYDCLYWRHGMTTPWNLIKLDINSMEFYAPSPRSNPPEALQ